MRFDKYSVAFQEQNTVCLKMKVTEAGSFMACACTEVDINRNRLPFVPNASCTELDLPLGLSILWLLSIFYWFCTDRLWRQVRV